MTRLALLLVFVCGCSLFKVAAGPPPPKPMPDDVPAVYGLSSTEWGYVGAGLFSTVAVIVGAKMRRKKG